MQENREWLGQEILAELPTPDSVAEMQRIARTYGIFIGPSSGAHLIAAKRLKKELNLDTVVTFFCDEGEKYMKDYWLKF